MAFTPPGLSILKVNTLNLDTQFSIKLGRYKIIASSLSPSSSAKPQSTLEVLIAIIQQTMVCNTERLTARDVFTQLANELNEIVKAEKKEQYPRAAMFLLGALLHRYFRLINEYDNFNGYTSFFFTPSSVTNCRLFKAVRLALQLPCEKKKASGLDILDAIDIPKNYKTHDLNILDVTTIVTALEVFRDNMNVLDEHKIPRYKKYPHFEKDVNFETYLQDIINVHKKRGIPVLNQYKAINFIQSLAAKVDAECQLIDEELIKWSKVLEKEHVDFNLLTQKEIEKHIIANIKPESLGKKIINLMQIPFISENLVNLDHGSFLDSMKKCQADTATYTIFGGYALLLQSQGIEQLKFCIYEALDIIEDPNELTDKDMLVGINRFLKPFLTNNPDIELDCEFFGGRDKLDTHVKQTLETVAKKVQSEEKAERALTF